MKIITYILSWWHRCLSACTQKRKSSSRTKPRTEQTVKLPDDAELVAKAKAGNARAQGLVAECYLHGTNGVKKNYKEAVKWYRLAAEQGNAVAQYELGVCYKNGEGVSQSWVEAVKWFRLAAEQGLAAAQCNLGVCYVNGNGVSQSYTEAVKWCRLAAEQGYVKAQFNLGAFYYNGDGVAKNRDTAIQWWKKAAAQGYSTAQETLRNLGVYDW